MYYSQGGVVVFFEYQTVEKATVARLWSVLLSVTPVWPENNCSLTQCPDQEQRTEVLNMGFSSAAQ